MNTVPYALNQVILYGRVTELRNDISAIEARVWACVQTKEGEDGHFVLVQNRRALELLAFYDAHMQMIPNVPFLISVNGHVRSRHGETLLYGDAITFHVSPQVRMWGGKLVRSMLQEYAQQYGARPWLGIDRQSNNGSTASEQVLSQEDIDG